MTIYYWNFPIHNMPNSPSGYNQGSPPPPPEICQEALIHLVDPSSLAFLGWWVGLVVEGMMGTISKDLLQRISNALKSGFLNVAGEPWRTLSNMHLGPPTKVAQAKLFALAEWNQIYSTYNQGASSGHEEQTTQGVTTTDSQTNEFSISIGISASAGWGPFSASISEEFSATTSQTHSVELTTMHTETNHFQIPANTYAQVWQLSMKLQHGEGGASISQRTNIFQTLTYPHRQADYFVKQVRQLLPEGLQDVSDTEILKFNR